MPYEAYIITILLLHSCSGLWKCNPSEDPNKCTKLKENSKFLPCKCVAEEIRKVSKVVKGINPDEFVTEFCGVSADWLEVATLSKNEVKDKQVSAEIGLTVKPSDFTDKLDKYSDWDSAKDKRSHNIMIVMKHYFCEQDSWYSEKTAADNFLYDFNFKERKITKTFSPIPGKDVVYSQLVANCKKGSETYFHIHFDVFTQPVVKISKPAHLDLSSIPTQTEVCQAVEAIEIAKVRPGENYIYSNDRTAKRLVTVDILIGIEVPGILAHEHEIPPTDPKIIEILDKMKSLTQTSHNHWWRHDFKWIFADKNSYHQIRVEIPPGGKLILYQTVAYCNNVTLRTSRVIESKVDKDGHCIDGYLPRFSRFKQSIITGDITERCSPIYKKMPELGNCVPNDYFIEIKKIQTTPCEEEVLNCDDLGHSKFAGVTWLNRSELVDYEEEFLASNITEKIKEKIRSIGKSEQTREDWSNYKSYDKLLLDHESYYVNGIGRERHSKLNKVRLYQLVVNCGQFILYTRKTYNRETDTTDGRCIDGSGGWACDQLDSNGKIFVPLVKS